MQLPQDPNVYTPALFFYIELEPMLGFKHISLNPVDSYIPIYSVYKTGEQERRKGIHVSGWPTFSRILHRKGIRLGTVLLPIDGEMIMEQDSFVYFDGFHRISALYHISLETYQTDILLVFTYHWTTKMHRVFNAAYSYNTQQSIRRYFFSCRRSQYGSNMYVRIHYSLSKEDVPTSCPRQHVLTDKPSQIYQFELTVLLMLHQSASEIYPESERSRPAK